FLFSSSINLLGKASLNLFSIKEAASSGFYKAGNGRNYDKIQILTIEELLNGEKKPEFFDMKLGELTFKKAQRENQNIAEQGELL
ncbi:MAG: hypothetical protein ACKPDM_00750, partial [Dolichospermum sp.]